MSKTNLPNRTVRTTSAVNVLRPNDPRINATSQNWKSKLDSETLTAQQAKKVRGVENYYNISRVEMKRVEMMHANISLRAQMKRYIMNFKSPTPSDCKHPLEYSKNTRILIARMAAAVYSSPPEEGSTDESDAYDSISSEEEDSSDCSSESSYDSSEDYLETFGIPRNFIEREDEETSKEDYSPAEFKELYIPKRKRSASPDDTADKPRRSSLKKPGDKSRRLN